MKTETARTPIVATLVELQAALGENDALFAERLGVNRTTWIHARTGVRQPGRKLLSGARRAFPGLERQILDSLASRIVPSATANGHTDNHAEVA